MHSKSTQFHTANLDVAAHVKQAQLMRNQVIADMISAGWQGAQRIATDLVKKSSRDNHAMAAPASTGS